MSYRSDKGSQKGMNTGVVIRANLEASDSAVQQSIKEMICALQESKMIQKVILAVPDTPYHREFPSTASGARIYTGNPLNMMDRMIAAAKAHHIDTIVDLGLRTRPGSIERIDAIIAFHHDKGGGYTEPKGWRQDVLPRIIDRDYLEKVKQLSQQWPYYGTISSHGMEKNIFPFPTEDMEEQFLHAMSIPNLVLLKNKVELLLQSAGHVPENPDAWIRRAQLLITSILKYKDDSNASVLEIGCGQRFGLGLILYLMGISSYTGIDLCPIMFDEEDLKLFYETLKTHNAADTIFSKGLPETLQHECIGTTHSFLNGKARVISPHDASNLPFANNHFDVVFSDAVLEHVENPWLVCGEMARVLKPGGIMFHFIGFEDHHPDTSGFRHLYCSKKAWENSCQQVFINLFRSSEFEAIFREHKLKIISCIKTKTEQEIVMDSVHNDYKSFSQEELTLSSVSFVLKK